jgi:hypothetical protein
MSTRGVRDQFRSMLVQNHKFKKTDVRTKFIVIYIIFLVLDLRRGFVYSKFANIVNLI